MMRLSPVGRFFCAFFREPRLQGVIALSLFLGFQFLTLWFIGEFSARTYHLLQQPPFFEVAEVLGDSEGVERN